MIYCVRFADFAAFVESIGFEPFAGTETTIVYVNADDGTALTVRRPNIHGDITEAAALAACYAAEVEPIAFDTHWCD